MSQRTCIRCDVPTERGYVPEHSDGNYLHLASWVRGEPVRSFWSGLKREPGTPLIAYRCPECGGVELVAPDKRNP
jgi:hypothetical protein